MHRCIYEENEPLFNLLLDCKTIDLNQTSHEGDTPLCIALKAEPCLQSFAEKLLSKKANPNPTYSTTDDTLLHILAREAKEEAALFLLEHVAKTNISKSNANGFTILHEACKGNLRELTKALLEHGLSPEDITLTGEAPIHFAVENRNIDVIQALLDIPNSTSQLNLKNADGETPLSLAIKSSFKQGRDIVAALIKAGADINEKNEKGLSLLHEAILKEDSASAIFLIESGSDINAT